MTTTFVGPRGNEDIVTGSWWPVNLGLIDRLEGPLHAGGAAPEPAGEPERKMHQDGAGRAARGTSLAQSKAKAFDRHPGGRLEVEVGHPLKAQA
ncbi:MAG TPA: hypothetical protein VEL48_13385, partial [Candidatus Acidoferrales bacterium]|nr:hypothetical protein [Candidatus Acidoferrales bacterium]